MKTEPCWDWYAVPVNVIVPEAATGQLVSVNVPEPAR